MLPPSPDNAAAISFLRRWSPEGPWALTSIQTDRKAIDTRTFYPRDEAALAQWLASYNGSRNIYFHVNPVLRDVKKKAEREDIKELAWLHVDVDPRAGEDIIEERSRALALLTDKLPKGIPAPTCIVFSGGGYQAFWRLKTPAPIDGELAKAEDLKRYNQQLERLFGGDNCHNIDRIMRLPGTLNIPDARKLKKGRQVELAKVVEFNDLVYELSEFTPAPSVQLPEGGLSSKPKVEISGNIERLADVNELDEWSVPDRVKVAIVQGRHPDQPLKGDNSRSAWLFYVCCNLVRCGVPDDKIFSILTDKEFGISESVLELGSRAEKYALRQMERAKEEVEDPWLRILNEKHAVIGSIGGKCRIIEEQLDEGMNRTRIQKQSFEDFRNRYRNQKTQIGMTKEKQPVLMAVGNWWVDHPQRRQYESIVFAPGREVDNCYNLWRGFSCDSIPGDCSKFLNHLRENVCQGRDELYQYLIHWMARAVQQPASAGEVAVVLRGGKGTGKSKTAKVFGSLFGRHFLHISNPSHLIGNFNSHLRDAVVLFADEAFYAGDKKHESILKMLVTEETIPIEAKGVDVEVCPNYVHLIMASNNTHIVPASGDERRYFVLDVGENHQRDHAYFAAIDEQMSHGGREALLHHLMTLDLCDFNVRKFPETEALREQKLLSLNVEEEWFFRKLQNGRILEESKTWETEVIYNSLVDDFIENTRRWMVTRRGSETSLGRFLSRVFPEMNRRQQLVEVDVMSGDGWSRKVKKRAYVLAVPDLDRCRKRWEELYGAQKWETPVEGEDNGEIPF